MWCIVVLFANRNQLKNKKFVAVFPLSCVVFLKRTTWKRYCGCTLLSHVDKFFKICQLDADLVRRRTYLRRVVPQKLENWDRGGFIFTGNEGRWAMEGKKGAGDEGRAKDRPLPDILRLLLSQGRRMRLPSQEPPLFSLRCPRPPSGYGDLARGRSWRGESLV